MHVLMLHRMCDLGPIRAVMAAVARTRDGIDAHFRIEGNVAALGLPEQGAALRQDELWRSTCFEVFWQPIGGTAYSEFNFAPSNAWAAYEFDSYREGMRQRSVDAINVRTEGRDDALTLTANVGGEFAAPAQVGLSAVIRHNDGGLQYWALAFAPGKPDFHSEATRQIIVQR